MEWALVWGYTVGVSSAFNKGKMIERKENAVSVQDYQDYQGLSCSWDVYLDMSYSHMQIENSTPQPGILYLNHTVKIPFRYREGQFDLQVTKHPQAIIANETLQKFFSLYTLRKMATTNFWWGIKYTVSLLH